METETIIKGMVFDEGLLEKFSELIIWMLIQGHPGGLQGIPPASG